ncbi:DnaJ subfamily C member 10 like [Actinidia chinensis var. chinensis]|uniref:DnaJ subfamily C member 10 like n=1 Tax=Actinidia chinensis var. chinensis TaxID=1590841 RepID=A0A2R6QH39_ACTCC|nr:DnaJ subfamily C member 10 like [Actinidia chinensis var. chinensis]
MANSSLASALKAYWFPLILFASSVFYQLIILPRSYPPSHYDVLGIKRQSSIEEVTEAYEKLSSKWNSGIEVPPTIDFIKIRYAFELLTNSLWKRNYDIFGIDEHIHVFEKVKEQYAGASFTEIGLPLLEAASFDPGDHAFNTVTSGNFLSKFENAKALLLQVFSFGSNRCEQFSNSWKKIDALLDGVINTGMVELGEVQLATYLSEKTFTGQPSFQNGLPSLVAFPPRCNSSKCLVRYDGELSVDAVTNWLATTILSLPRIPYYSKDSLEQRFLAKSGPHKVKVILFSETGERATPFVRQTALNYWPFTAFAFVLWKEEESSLWWNVFGVESAPAIVFLKEPGIKPVVYHGPFNNSWLVNIMEQNKHHELPQLRSVTSMELGCDARGYSRAGNETAIWYCVILAGRPSQELNKMRETVRRVQEILSNDDKLHTIDEDQPSAPSIVALKEKRLTFTWLDGEAQQRYCFFIIQTMNSYETCGPRRDITDVPQLIIVRYKRDAIEESIKIEKKPKNILEAFQNDDMDPASQLVARYNGSEEIPEIIKWISQIIEDGDSKDLPFFRAKAPALVPEDADPIWAVGAKSVLSSGTGMKQRISTIINGIHKRLGDPRIGPVLLLGALMSFGNIWLRRSQSTHSSPSNNQTQPSRPDEDRPSRRRNRRTASNQDAPPSITDMEPKGAYQMPLSGSDSE